MSVIVFPDYAVAAFRWRKVNQAIMFRSPFGAQSIDAAAPLWEVELAGVPSRTADAVLIETMLESLDGFRNQLALWNLVRPIPVGTMRGTMVLDAPAAQGTLSLSIAAAGEAGKTLLQGDLLGIGTGITQQAVRVAADATADGSSVIAVTLGTPLRNAFSAGTPVTWNKPMALFRQKSLNEGIEYVPAIGQPWSLQLIEDWRP